MTEPPEKKQKTGDSPAAEEEEIDHPNQTEDAPDEAETSALLVPTKAETEKDSDDIPAADKIKEPIRFLPADTTLNFLQSSNNRLLMSMNEGGIQHLLAGARANVGVKSGRYFFEIKIIEYINGVDSAQAVVRPKTVIRLGFSKADAPLLLGSGDDAVGFDADGYFWAGKKSSYTFPRAGRGSILGVLLNLDSSSDNFNTISLFRDGHRLTQPQSLPDNLEGETLYPHLTFRNVTLQVNFGPSPLAPLPFKCNMIADASKKSVEVTKAAKPPKGKKYEVVYPIGLPDQGTFDALDLWLQDHPDYMELSDRTFLDWIDQSGIRRPRNLQAKSSNDKPEMHYQVREIEDGSIRRAVFSLAPLMDRNFVVMEVCDNLLPDARTENLKLFPSSRFSKTALVSVGEPNDTYLEKAKEIALAAKQEAADRAFKSHRLVLKAQQEAAKRRKEALKAEGKEEEKEDEEEIPDVDMSEKPPKVELTNEEEEALSFIPHDVKDLTPFVLSGAFSHFALPSKAEGFDTIKYEWENESSSQEYLKSWIAQKKLTLRADDLQPGPWAPEQQQKWLAAVAAWHEKADEYKAVLAEKQQKKQQAKREKEIAAARAQVTGDKVDGQEATPMETEEQEEETLDFASVDVFAAEDILDVGLQTPLFKEFGYEDWALMTLRFRLHLLAHAFKRDIQDPERPGIFLDHLPFYYNRYFKEPLNLREYGVETLDALVKLVDDTAYVTPDRVLESQIGAEMETFNIFVKLTEEARRHRLLRLELGDESAKLSVTATTQLSGKTNHKKGGGKTSSEKGSWSSAGKGKKGGSPQAPPAGKGLVPTISASASSSPSQSGSPAVVGPPSHVGKSGGKDGKGKDKGSWSYGYSYAGPSTVGGAAAAAAAAAERQHAAMAPIGSGGPIGGGGGSGGGGSGGYSSSKASGKGGSSSYSYGKSPAAGKGKPGYASKGSSPYAAPAPAYASKGKGKAPAGRHVPPPRR